MPLAGTEGAKRRRPAQSDDDSAAAAADGLPVASPALGSVDGELAQPVTLLTEKWKLLPAFLKVRPGIVHRGVGVGAFHTANRSDRHAPIESRRR